MAIEQAVDEMQVAGPAAAGTDRKFAGQMRFGASRERCHFLMTHMHPLDLALPANRIGQAVEAVADDAVNPLDADGRESLRELICNRFHTVRPSPSREASQYDNMQWHDLLDQRRVRQP